MTLFSRPFVFNGTSSFDKIFERLGDVDWTSIVGQTQYTIKGNQILVNVAGVERENIEASVDVENQKIEIQTPESNVNIKIPTSLAIETPEQVKMSYKAGLLTFEISELEKPETPSKTKLSFS